ncbi:hypothetical protein D3C75_753690 [compost metagenome]
MLEQVVNRNCKIMVRIHQTSRRDDTVAVVIRVVGERQIEFVTQRQQTRHCAFGGAIHADSAIFIQMHKAEGLIDMIVNNRQIQIVVFRYALPVFDTGTAERINTQFQTRFLDGGHINDVHQPFDKRLHQILFLYVTACPGFIQRDAFYIFQTRGQQCVGAIFNHFGDVGISRTTIWRIVFDTTIFRRVVRRRDDDTIGLCATVFVMRQNSVRDGRRWRVAICLLHNDIHTVCSQHFEHGDKRRFR